MQTKLYFTKRQRLNDEKCQDCDKDFGNFDTVFDLRPMTKGKLPKPVCSSCVLTRHKLGIDDHRKIETIKKERERERLKAEQARKEKRIKIKASARS